MANPLTPPSDAAQPADAKNPRILLIEDDPLLARALGRLLRAGGAQVTHAASGAVDWLYAVETAKFADGGWALHA